MVHPLIAIRELLTDGVSSGVPVSVPVSVSVPTTSTFSCYVYVSAIISPFASTLEPFTSYAQPSASYVNGEVPATLLPSLSYA